jgi:ATP-dependent DNA helicase RecG
VMIVAHADRFGISQLHQLRGRIGRSRMDAWCFLMKDESCSAQAARRLGIMASTDDGFVIAEQDLRIRGPGEIAGTRQHGLPSFRVASIVRDADLLEKAASIASGGRDWPRLREEFEWRFGNPGIPEI